VAAACRVLHQAQQDDLVWGHVSCRDPLGRGAWIKAGSRGFDETTVADVILIDFDGATLKGSGKPPWEFPIHTEILRARPDVNAVVHTHPPHAITIGACGLPLEAFSHAAGVFGGDVPRFEDGAGLVDTLALGASLAGVLGDARAVLIAGHGIATVGASVGAAVITAILLEQACRLQLMADAVGGPSERFRGPAGAALYAHTTTDGFLLRPWDYLLRRARAG
jgi:ribulose-5-phosphate 4-epimerase/fuculose-1-phosphate aldolase